MPVGGTYRFWTAGNGVLRAVDRIASH